MRYLSKGQKRILKDYAKNRYFDSDLLINKFNNKTILLMQLEKVNDYETLNWDVNRLIDDLLFTDTLEEKIKVIDNFR